MRAKGLSRGPGSGLEEEKDRMRCLQQDATSFRFKGPVWYLRVARSGIESFGAVLL